MRRYPLYIFDLDGTLYRGSEAIPGASEVVAKLRSEGAMVRFLTNNSSQTPAAQAAKLAAMGFDASPGEVLTSGIGAGRYLVERGLTSVFVVGEPGLVAVLQSAGVGTVPHSSGGCAAVVAGICRTLTYDMIDEAMQRIRGGATFIATNTDATYPMEGGRQVPGAGAVVAAIQACTGVEPKVIGKPNPYLIQVILEETAVAARDALVVGDRYETDIVSGESAGCDTLMVLTGVSERAPAGAASAETLEALLR